MFHIYRIFFIFLTVESNDAPTDQESNEGYKTENVCAGSVFDRSPMDHAGLVLYRKMARKNKHWSTKKLFGKNIKNNAGICFHIIPCPEEIRRKQDSGCVSIVFSLYNAPNSRTHVTWWKRKGPLPSFFLYKKKMRVQLALVSKIDTKKLPFFYFEKEIVKNKKGRDGISAKRVWQSQLSYFFRLFVCLKMPLYSACRHFRSADNGKREERNLKLK